MIPMRGTTFHIAWPRDGHSPPEALVNCPGGWEVWALPPVGSTMQTSSVLGTQPAPKAAVGWRIINRRLDCPGSSLQTQLLLKGERV